MRAIVGLVIIAGILCVAIVYGGHGYSKSYAVKSMGPSVPIAQGYTVEFGEFSNGLQTGRSVRYVKSSGEWFEETHSLNPDGSVSGSPRRQAGLLGRGTITIDDAAQKLLHIGSASYIGSVQADTLRASSNYSRDDTLLGYRAIVQRNCTSSGQLCTEYWLIPEIGSDLFKYASTTADGSTTVKVATSIVLGNPNPFPIPNYPMEDHPFR